MANDGNLKRDSAWMMGGQVFATGFQAVYFVLIGRAIGSAQYGAFVGVAAFLSVLGQFSTVGMEMLLIRDVSRDRGRFSSAWGLTLELAVLGFAATTAIALLAGRLFLKSDVYWLIPGIAVSDLLFAKIAMLSGKAFQSVGNFAFSAKVTAMTNLTRALTAGCLYLYTLHIHRLATAQMWTSIYWMSSLVAAVIGVSLVTWEIGSPRWARLDFRSFFEGVSFSLTICSVSIYNDIDKTILVSLGQNQAAGIYSAAYRIVDVVSTPIYSIYSAAFPSFFREGAKSIRDALRLASRVSRKTVPYSLAAAAAMALGAGLLPHILGQSFADSVSALRWLCLIPLFRSFHYAAGMIITGSVSPWYRTTLQVTAATLNFALNMILIPRYSWQGAAAASLLSDGSLAAMNWIAVVYLMHKQERGFRPR
ncbi:MAG: oligosaccharide flippase family protein [Terracidiphilus sp.]|jgi:O-antigen/teichoic acid export membrane protein